MAIIYMLLASVFVSFSNFFMRKSIDRGGTTKGFLVFQMLTALGVAILLNPVKTGRYEINLPIVLFGTAAGVVLAGLLYFLGRALEKGPPGLTFSIVNAATVFPAIFMTLFFGASMGYPYTPWHAFGSLLVLGGLFWAGKGLVGLADKRKWLFFALSMFSFHIILLFLFQWRALLLNVPNPEEIFSLFVKESIRSQWFMPSMFLSAASIQTLLFLRLEKRKPYSQEVSYGVLGGIGNGFCTYFMIQSTEVATPLENAVIYPVFSVVTIILSNLWGQKLYQEEVNWKACNLSAFGLIIGTVDWKSVAAAIGLAG